MKYTDEAGSISRRDRSPCRRRTPPAVTIREISDSFLLYEGNDATNLLFDLLLFLFLGSGSRGTSSSGGGCSSTASSSTGRDRGELAGSLGDQLFSSRNQYYGIWKEIE